MPGLIVTEAVCAMLDRHPQLTMNVLRTSWDDQTAVLHDGRADVSYVRQPFDQQGLHVQALLTEPRVAVLPVGHHLAGKDAIGTTDLADEQPQSRAKIKYSRRRDTADHHAPRPCLTRSQATRPGRVLEPARRLRWAGGPRLLPGPAWRPR